MNSNQSRLRGSPEQFLVLVDFMESYGDLSRPQAGPQGRIRQDRLWQELTSLINSIGGGVVKPQEKWKKVWADMKAKSKKKCSLIRRQSSGTGGGPSHSQSLTALEERIIAIIGVSAVTGQIGIQEHGFYQPLQHDVLRESEGRGCQLSLEVPFSNISSTLSQSQNIPPAASPQVIQPMPAVASPLLPATPAPAPISSAANPPSPAPTPRAAPLPALIPPAAPAPTVLPRAATPPPRPKRVCPTRHHPTAESPGSIHTSPRRRLLVGARRNRGLTPFDRAASEFVAIEQGRVRLEEARLKSEEERDVRFHEREMERLRLESERIEVTRQQNQLLQQLGVIAIRLLDTLRSSSSSLPSTVTLSETE